MPSATGRDRTGSRAGCGVAVLVNDGVPGSDVTCPMVGVELTEDAGVEGVTVEGVAVTVAVTVDGEVATTGDGVMVTVAELVAIGPAAGVGAMTAVKIASGAPVGTVA